MTIEQQAGNTSIHASPRTLDALPGTPGSNVEASKRAGARANRNRSPSLAARTEASHRQQATSYQGDLGEPYNPNVL